jgi:TolB-like protein
MKRLSFSFLLFAVLACVVQAQQLAVAVSPFETRGGLTKDEADVVTELFIAELVAEGTVKVVDRNSFDKIMTEMKFQSSDWADSARVAQLGKALNANSIIRGTVMTLAGQTVITSTILDINTAQILSSSTLRMKGIDEIFDKLPVFVKEMMKNLPDPPGVYKVGGKGQAGGIVFYDKGVFSNGWRYLEAAPAETEFKAQWGAYGKTVGGTGTGVGSGKENTRLIIQRLRQLGETGKAVQSCAGLDFGGCNDWFLPSQAELDLIYKNLKLKGLGGFSGNGYWSSSEGYGSYSCLQRFSDGHQSEHLKDDTISVRAVRAF